jgi:hypothetical protein
MKTRQAGVKAKLAELIEMADSDVVFYTVFAAELRKIRAEDYPSVRDLVRNLDKRGVPGAYSIALDAQSAALDERP